MTSAVFRNNNSNSTAIASSLPLNSSLSPTATTSNTTINTTNNNDCNNTPRYCTWLVFMNNNWVPFDQHNQYKLDQTLSLQGTFVDIQDSHFPSVKRVRVFPKSNHLSYLGVKYRISKVMQTDVWRFS